MADPKKPVPKPITDVAHPGKSAPSTTSKPVIVTNRPVLRDPMVNAPAEDKPAEPAADETAKTAPTVPKAASGGKVITPLNTEDTKAADSKPTEAETATKTDDTQETEAKSTEAASTTEAATKPEETTTEKPTPESEPTPADTPLADGQNADAKAEAEAEAEAAKQTEHNTAIQKLVDSKQYYLPINSVEQRKSKRFVAVGILLALILAVAWVDIALDAGLISLGNVQPVTHFFSN